MRLEPAGPSTPLPPSERRKFGIAALNGTAIYILTYYIVWGLHQGMKIGVSRHYNLRGVWDPSRIVYSVADNDWWRSAIIAVYGAGPLACLIVGYLAYRRYWRHERAYRGQFKLLLLWLAFHCCNAVFGALLADSITKSGFWYVPDWVFQLGNVIDVLFAILAGLAQLALGYFGAIAFLQAHDSMTVMRHEYRQLMVVCTLIVPWVVGSGFIALTKMPYFSLHESMHLMAMGLLVTPLALGCLNEFFSDTVERPQPTHVVWGIVALAVISAITWRLVLSPPLAFG